MKIRELIAKLANTPYDLDSEATVTICTRNERGCIIKKEVAPINYVFFHSCISIEKSEMVTIKFEDNSNLGENS